MEINYVYCLHVYKTIKDGYTTNNSFNDLPSSFHNNHL